MIDKIFNRATELMILVYKRLPKWFLIIMNKPLKDNKITLLQVLIPKMPFTNLLKNLNFKLVKKNIGLMMKEIKLIRKPENIIEIILIYLIEDMITVLANKSTGLN
jgi:hypothetical protein